MALIAPIIGIALQGAFIAVLGVGGYLVAYGTMQVAELVAFILYLFMMIMPLGQVFQAYTAMQNALGRGDPDPGDRRAARGGVRRRCAIAACDGSRAVE